MNMFKKNGGFTLVELIVVIAILAILAGVAIPAYSGYIKSANDAAVETELSAVKTAVMAANATKGEVTGLVVNSTTVVVTATTFSDTFEADFETYYGIAADKVSWNATTGTLTFTAAEFDFAGSSYEGKNATWSNNKWEPTT